jgi:hypothetical protein
VLNVTAAFAIVERCDRCRATAAVRVVLEDENETESDLYFCQHHLNKYGSKLCDLGATIITIRKEN